MDEPTFIPVYGSAKDIRARIVNNNLEGQFTAITPIQAILSGTVSKMSFPDVDADIFHEDVCFLLSSEQMTDDDQKKVVSLLKVTEAPVSMISGDDEDSNEEEMLSDLEQDMIGDGENMMGIFHRFQDTVTRAQHRDVVDDVQSVIVPQRGKILSSMFNRDSTQALIMIKFPMVTGNNPSHLPEVTPDIEGDISSMFSVLRVSEDEEGKVSPDPDGDYLFITDSSSAVFIETMTPCAVTSISIHDDIGTHQVRSWIIHDNEISGTSRMISEGFIEEVEEHILSMGLELEDIEYVWANDIPVNQVSLLSPIYSDDVMADIEQKFSEDDSQ